MCSVGAATAVAVVGSAGLVFRSRNSLSFLKSSRSGSSMLPWCKAAAGMQQGEEDKVFQVERLAANLCDPHLPFQQCLRRPISQRADQFRMDHGDLLHQKGFACLDFIRFRVAVVRGAALDHIGDVDIAA